MPFSISKGTRYAKRKSQSSARLAFLFNRCLFVSKYKPCYGNPKPYCYTSRNNRQRQMLPN
jgi:hypothetical protein